MPPEDGRNEKSGESAFGPEAEGLPPRDAGCARTEGQR